MKKLMKGEDTAIAGVISGFANMFSIDVTLLRVITLLLFISSRYGGTVLTFYIICWICMPDYNPKDDE